MKRRNLGTVITLIVLSLALFAAVILLAGDVVIIGGARYTARFDNVGGITRGSAIRVSGLRVGTVGRVVLDPVDQVSVLVELIMVPDRYIRVEDQVAIGSAGLLGDQIIQITPGPIDADRWPTNREIDGIEAADLTTLLDDVPALAAQVRDALGSLAALLDASGPLVAESLTGISEAAESVSRIGQELEGLVADARGLTSPLQSGIASVDALAAELGTAVRELSRLTATLSSEESVAAIGTTIQQLQAVSENLLITSQAVRELFGELEDSRPQD